MTYRAIGTLTGIQARRRSNGSKRRKRRVRRESMRRMVKMRMIVPRDGPVDLASAEWRVCVEVANADGLHDMLAIIS